MVNRTKSGENNKRISNFPFEMYGNMNSQRLLFVYSVVSLLWSVHVSVSLPMKQFLSVSLSPDLNRWSLIRFKNKS